MRCCSICLGLAVFCLAGCSIKADRTECPCFLDVTVKGGTEALSSLRIISESGAEAAVVEGMRVGQVVCVPVPRGENLRIVSCSGIHSCRFDGLKACLPCSGLEMDELYAGFESLHSEGDRAQACVTLHKQYALLSISFTGADAGEFPFDICLEGGYSGIELDGMTPSEGAYNVMVLPVVGTYRRICLPRQGGAPLTLSFQPKDGGSVRSPDPVDLGGLIEEYGYDWKKEDLDDILVEIKYENARPFVTVAPWTTITVNENEF